MISSFAPSVNGEVCRPGQRRGLVVDRRTFTSVNGTARRGVAKLNPTTGAVDTAFNANLASGKVTELALVGGRLLAGGTFPGKLRALNPATGLALSWNPGKERGVGGKDLYVTPAGLWVGSDTNRIGGETRRRIALMPVP